MASVSSLDQDMRQLRRDRYTPQAANEARRWIEDTLGTTLPSGDLLDALKDGVALCKLANLALPPPGVKFKQSSMPFVQMENISQFLKACEMPPLNLPAHDRFLTVDLYEGKDPAQVLQCLGAFSRKANAAQPSRFRSTIGPRSIASPTAASTSFGSVSKRPISPTKPADLTRSLTGGSTGSHTSTATRSTTTTGNVSSWSSKRDEGVTNPAWNIVQYGYMGGASQGNQGITFGARRQITSAAPSVPGLAEKERLRKQKEEEERRAKREAEEEEQRRRSQREAEEARAREEEELRWQEESKRHREDERLRLEEQKRQWEEQEKRWKEEEEARKKEEERVQASLTGSGLLRGQTLSQYRKEQAQLGRETPGEARVRELEKQLEEARLREKQYQAERERGERSRPGTAEARLPERLLTSRKPVPGPKPAQETAAETVPPPPTPPRNSSPFARPSNSINSPSSTERETTPFPFRPAHAAAGAASSTTQQSVEDKDSGPFSPPLSPRTEKVPSQSRPLFSSRPSANKSTQRYDSLDSIPSLPSDLSGGIESSPLGSPNRPVPVPVTYRPYSPTKPPQPEEESHQQPTSLPLQKQNPSPFARPPSSASAASFSKGNRGWGTSSLLEREMERERERQREWEANQSMKSNLKADGRETTTAHSQFSGFTGGDTQNRGSSAGSGINFGGKRQIIGPRPAPGR